MVSGVINLVAGSGLTTDDQALGATITGPWSLDGEFVIVPARLPRQKPLMIAEDDAVFRIREWPALPDQ